MATTIFLWYSELSLLLSKYLSQESSFYHDLPCLSNILSLDVSFSKVHSNVSYKEICIYKKSMNFYFFSCSWYQFLILLMKHLPFYMFIQCYLVVKIKGFTSNYQQDFKPSSWKKQNLLAQKFFIQISLNLCWDCFRCF